MARKMAQKVLSRIDRKLEGHFVPYRSPALKAVLQNAPDKVVGTNGLVDMLIREAKDIVHLVRVSPMQPSTPC